MIWRFCLNHNSHACHPEVRWANFFPEDGGKEAASKSGCGKTLDEICAKCSSMALVIEDKECPVCRTSRLAWGSPKTVKAVSSGREFFYHYMCEGCGRTLFSKDLIVL